MTPQSVLVTGASRGIGKEIARRFAEAGATRIAIGYLRNDAAAEQAAEELRGLGAEPVLVRGNIASTRVADEIAGLGPLDAVVHAAATGVIRPALETTDKHFDWTMAANARAFLSLARAAAPQMQPGSSLVAISSLGSVRVLENYVLDRHVEGCPGGTRPVPRGRAGTTGNPRERRLGRSRRDGRARPLPEP